LVLPDDVVHRSLPVRDGGEVHLVELGEGPAVVLLHGANLSAEVWSYQLRDLCGKHRVIALDLRGHGRSVAGAEDVTISAMAEDVAELLVALDLDDALVAGHSMGGMVCLRLLRRHPEMLGGEIGAVALISTSAGLGLPVPSWGRLAGAVSLVAGASVGIWRPGRAMPTGDAGYLASRIGFGKKARPAEVAATLAMLRAVEPEVFGKLVAEVLSFEESAPFDTAALPVAVAVGTSDHLTPPLYARKMAAGFEAAVLSEYPGAGHMLMYERRAEIGALFAALSERAGEAQAPGSKSTLTAPVVLASAKVSTASRHRSKA
jgi:pimeloyl-ACP methyl ester carboxylesterase